MLISIIIPTYNRAVVIQKALDSVIAQTYINWECIVVDDGSTDATLEVLKKYNEQDSRILFFKRERLPKGAPTCRNIGLEHAKGDYVIFLDSDDYLLPFCLEQRIKTFNQYPDCDFLVFPMSEQNDNGIVKKEIPFYDDYLVPFLSANIIWQTMCPIWNKSFLLELKGFTEEYPRFNDPELMIRALVQVNVKFKVFNNLDFDTVHLLNVKDIYLFKSNIYKSLSLFIPDISKALNDNRKPDYKSYLSHYLHFWFKYIYLPANSSNIIQSTHLISLFWKNKVISLQKSTSLFLRLLLYSISKKILKKPINKLSDKAYYF